MHEFVDTRFHRLVLVIVMSAALVLCAGGDVLAQELASDGKTDVTGALQKLIDQTAEKGGAVKLPAGQYLVAGSITIPSGVTLCGVWEAPHHGLWDKGTTIMATRGRGSEKGPALFEMQQSSALRGLTILYPEQDPVDIKPYPWTLHGKGMHVTVENVTLVNSYNGIAMGPESNELHLIRNVFGCVLRRGVLVDRCTDIGRIENVHFNPHYLFRSGYSKIAREGGKGWKEVVDFQKENLEGFIIGKTDWEYILNCFVIFPKYGFRFLDMGNGPGNAVVLNSGSDIGPCAFRIEKVQGHAGVAFTNCQIMSGVEIAETNDGPVKFANCGFWSVKETKTQVDCAGGSLIMTACHFDQWAVADPNAPCILVRGGRLTLNGCDFFRNKKHVLIDEKARSAVIVGNQFRGGARIENRSAGDIQVGFNAGY